MTTKYIIFYRTTDISQVSYVNTWCLSLATVMQMGFEVTIYS